MNQRTIGSPFYFSVALDVGHIRFLAFTDILYVYLKKDALKIRLTDGRFLEKKSALKSLCGYNMLQSFIIYSPYLMVNQHYISSVVKENDELILTFTDKNQYEEDYIINQDMITQNELIFM